MNFKTTIVLLVLVLGLGAFLLWKHDEVVAKPETGMTPLLPFAVAQVDSIRLKLGTGEELAMSKQDGEWWLTEPVKDIAEQDRVKEFLALMAQAVRFELEASPSPEALNALGLSGPDSRVTLTAGATTWSLRVGSRDASGAFVHVMEEGEQSLARTGANLGNVLARAQRVAEPALRARRRRVGEALGVGASGQAPRRADALRRRLVAGRAVVVPGRRRRATPAGGCDGDDS